MDFHPNFQSQSQAVEDKGLPISFSKITCVIDPNTARVNIEETAHSTVHRGTLAKTPLEVDPADRGRSKTVQKVSDSTLNDPKSEIK